MKNSLYDLTNHLFAALERLNDEALTEPEHVKVEIARAAAAAGVAREVIAAGSLALRAAELRDALGDTGAPAVLGFDRPAAGSAPRLSGQLREEG